ncbi:MAG TPA: hypothetical protein ENK04_07530 [Gammaproteobacteria bacterium]|nr:hypothetical protein [Gammaproteobacteria bacterium]
MYKNSHSAVNFTTLIVLLLLSGAVHSAGSISVISGNKTLDWRQVESQRESGFGFELNDPGWDTAMVVTYLSSEESTTLEGFGGAIKATGKTTEIGFGARKYLTEDSVRFFLEGGAAVISGSLELAIPGESVSDSASTIGFWFGAGGEIMLEDIMSVGFFSRVSSAPVTLFDIDSDIGGTHFNLYVSYHFGR